MGKFREPVLNIDWDMAVSDLAARGWARASQALAANEADRLGDDNGRTWTVAGNERVVRQHVRSSSPTLAMPKRTPAVRTVGGHLIAGLSAAARRHTQPALRAFSEATWGRYPTGIGHIAAHRDPGAYGGPVLNSDYSATCTGRVV